LIVAVREIVAEAVAESAACIASAGAKPMLELAAAVKPCPTDEANDIVADTRAEKAPWMVRVAERAMDAVLAIPPTAWLTVLESATVADCARPYA
jgi:hypothetical protein